MQSELVRADTMLAALREIANPSPHIGGWQGLAIWMRSRAEAALPVEDVTTTDEAVANDFRTASDEIARLQRLVDAYRLAAVNEGWVHRMVDAYGFKEYTRQRIMTIDALAERTIASGYDAAGYLRDHAKGPSE